ncbi:outer membrane beta-barrel domain-containing protein [Microvenator marinus]|jgi:outer membrane beta-barrel protein|uniref:Outer membrane beta-barrel domain-containing protein n=1 Tax=Microvenator marinus TaxID=2600177 RepID=A0A5B8XLD3_9DELT|nr:outer membrane beta-barrel domain-containing protein [Microvenator marinus]QED25897.1 outer membrane beta-barrel domain-containing protein [Microvenator marinus]
MTKATVSLLGCTLVSLLSIALPSVAEAQQVRAQFDDKIHVLQPKPVLQKGRFELAPRFGVSVNDDVYRSFKLGLNANYHLSETFYIGGLFDWFDFGDAIGGVTASYEAIANQTGASADSPVVQWAGGLELGYVPFMGKLSLFNSAIVYYDFAVSVGGMWINAGSVSIPSAAGKPGGTIALSGRFFTNKWIAFTVEVRDLIFMQDLEGVSGALSNVLTFAGGFSFYLPTTFEYTQEFVDSED